MPPWCRGRLVREAPHRLASQRIALERGPDARGQGRVRGLGPTTVENYLIVGSDSRAGANPTDPDYGAIVGTEPQVGQRSDTIMILRFDPATNTASLLSLPRDL